MRSESGNICHGQWKDKPENMRCIKEGIKAMNLQAEEKCWPHSGTKAQMTTRWTCLYQLNFMSKSWNAGWWPLVMPKQNSRLELKMTEKLANKWGILWGRRGKDGSLYFLFCQIYQQLTEVTCYASKDKLHFQPKLTENILMYRVKNIA